MKYTLLCSSIRFISLVSVPLRMPYIKFMSMTLIPINGLKCHRQAITLAFLTSLEGSWLLLVGVSPLLKKRTNKVSTFDESSQIWRSFYPDLLSVRSKPGVVSHLEYVIVAGGDKGDDVTVTQNDIEVLNWIENSHWRKVVIKLPAPIYGFTPTISDDYILIVGYYGTEKLSCCGKEKLSYNGAYKIPVARIIASTDQVNKNDTPTKWIELTVTDHWENSHNSQLLSTYGSWRG